MSCPQYDWKAYALGELDAPAKNEAAAHLAVCANCREEVAGVNSTLAAIATLREEEIPRRIAFVSDKVFEPRWWQRVFNPTFASACVLAGAIVFHAEYSSRGPSQAEVQAQIDRAVAVKVEERTAGLDRLQAQMLQIYKTNMQLVNY